MNISIQLIFYSMYGHIYKMAEAVVAAARQLADTEVTLLQVPELVPEDILVNSGAKKARDAFTRVPVAKPQQLTEPDAIIFGTPTRHGNTCGQMRNFADHIEPFWAQGAFNGKACLPEAASRRQHARES